MPQTADLRVRLTPLVGSMLIGAATGIRSCAGLAAMTLTSHAPVSARSASAVALAGELVVDKLPTTPSRLEPPGLVGRLVLGAATAAALARRGSSNTSTVLAAAAVGLASAGAASVAGARWRGFAATKFGADLPGALIEDALGLGLAARAVLSA